MIATARLKTFVPFDALTDSNLERLAEQLKVEQLPAGSVLCHEGKSDNDAIYLLQGSVEVTSQTSTMKQVLTGGTPDAVYALAPGTPRQFSIQATTPVQILRVDHYKLDRITVFESVTTIITTIKDVWDNEDDVDREWTKVLEANPAFKRLPSKRVNHMIKRMEEVSVKPRQLIVQQGKPNKYYYVVKDFRFTVSCKDRQGKVQIANEITRGGSFGEESVATGSPSGTTVIAMTAGTLMRLAKSDFDKFLKS